MRVIVLRAILALAVLMCPGILVAAEKLAIIVNEANQQSITVSDIKNMYSDHITEWEGGGQIKLYELPSVDPMAEKFSRKVLGLSAKEAAAAWANRKITNRAKNPPRVSRDRLVAMSVSRDIRAIGYVGESVAKSRKGVKIIFTFE